MRRKPVVDLRRGTRVRPSAIGVTELGLASKLVGTVQRRHAHDPDGMIRVLVDGEDRAHAHDSGYWESLVVNHPTPTPARRRTVHVARKYD